MGQAELGALGAVGATVGAVTTPDPGGARPSPVGSSVACACRSVRVCVGLSVLLTCSDVPRAAEHPSVEEDLPDAGKVWAMYRPTCSDRSVDVHKDVQTADVLVCFARPRGALAGDERRAGWRSDETRRAGWLRDLHAGISSGR